MSKVSPVPPGYHTVTPYLIVVGAERLIDFMKRAFDAEEVYRSPKPDGTLGHCQVRIGDSMVELADGNEQWKPKTCVLHLYVPDADAIYAKAIAAGATSLFEPADTFYGDRSGGVEDPCGNHWYIATRQEELSKEEVERRAKAAGKG
ncbi:MAG TPA: VOC family protein [Thermoanaerobaculia bacterium]|nr:VOC family protein [Thermoanaerobaculia bacterium]